MEIVYHGHSCIEIRDGETCLVVDPFLSPNNPVADVSADDIDATHIAVTHGHADHIADAVPLATRTGAETVAMVEVAKWLAGKGVENVHDPNLGGTVRFDWGSIKLVPAWHTNTLPGEGPEPFSAESGVAVGVPAGLVINIGGKNVYHAGDTCLFGDMRLMAERGKVDVALLPIGGHYTMDRWDAAVAADFLKAGTVIPIHYNTFPAIETDVDAFCSDVESQTAAKAVRLDPGESYSA